MIVVGVLLLVVVLLIFFQTIKGWFTGQHSNEIPDDITYHEPQQGFDPTMPPKLRTENIELSEEFLDGGDKDPNVLSITIRNYGNSDAKNLTIVLKLSTEPEDIKKRSVVS